MLACPSRIRAGCADEGRATTGMGMHSPPAIGSQDAGVSVTVAGVSCRQRTSASLSSSRRTSPVPNSKPYRCSRANNSSAIGTHTRRVLAVSPLRGIPTLMPRLGTIPLIGYFMLRFLHEHSARLPQECLKLGGERPSNRKQRGRLMLPVVDFGSRFVGQRRSSVAATGGSSHEAFNVCSANVR